VAIRNHSFAYCAYYRTFADKQDEDLFVVDSSLPKTKATVLSVKQKRKLNAKKPMRSYQALENTSKVQDPIAKR